MKIGEFAKKHQLSIDTVRFYVNEGLLIPMKDGYHYQFDQQCSNDLTNILLLKDAGFSLQEIKILILSENVSTYAQEDWRQKYRDIFLRKQEHIKAEIHQLTQAQQFIEERLSQQEGMGESQNAFGFPLNLLPYLACPLCGKPLNLQSNMIEQNQIITGTLVCSSCQCSMEIQDGILIANHGGEIVSSYSSYDYFITQADPNLMVSILQNVKWMKKCFYNSEHPLRIILELGSGFGFFLRNTYNLIPDDALYIAVDYDINRHLFLKQTLKNCAGRKNIALICCDLGHIPLKPGIADRLIDFGTSTDLAWYRPEFSLELADRFTHEHTDCIFANRAYERFDFHSPVKPEFRKYLLEKHILNKFNELKYQVIRKERLDFLEKLQPANQFMNCEDSIYKLLIYAKKD